MDTVNSRSTAENNTSKKSAKSLELMTTKQHKTKETQDLIHLVHVCLKSALPSSILKSLINQLWNSYQVATKYSKYWRSSTT